MEKKLRLYGFNNLTKTLSFNIYDVCYAKGAREQKEYIDYIDEQYNADRLTEILTNQLLVTKFIASLQYGLYLLYRQTLAKTIK